MHLAEFLCFFICRKLLELLETTSAFGLTKKKPYMNNSVLLLHLSSSDYIWGRWGVKMVVNEIQGQKQLKAERLIVIDMPVEHCIRYYVEKSQLKKNPTIFCSSSQ